MGKTSKHLFVLILVVPVLGCCPEVPEGCPESPGSLRYHVDGVDPAGDGTDCDSIDIAASEVVAFEQVEKVEGQGRAERGCGGDCPQWRIRPAGSDAYWAGVRETDSEPPWGGTAFATFTAAVDGCNAQLTVVISPRSDLEGGSDYFMSRTITWDPSCDDHQGTCQSGFLMTELPAED